MGLFRSKKKTTIVIKTSKQGGVIKRFRAFITVGVVVAILNAIGLSNYLPEGLVTEVAEVVLKVIDLVFAWYVMRQTAPVIQAAANAQQPEQVAEIKKAAGVKE